jgi:cyclohexa-1,5-dienecarbonyl-CoA hydratase
VADQDDPHDYDVYSQVRSDGYRFIQFEAAQGVARINLNRPPANVLSIELMEELNRALESLEYQRDTKLVVLTASGKYFSAGFELSEHLGDRAYLMLEGFRRVFENLGKLDKPTLAVVGGAANGAGSILAAGCDLVLCSASAKFSFPEIKAGVFNTVGVALLPKLLGRKRAFELILSGGGLNAQDAERLGLVTRVVPDERLEAETGAWIQRFQEASAPVVQLARRAIYSGLDHPLLDAVTLAEDVYLNQLMATEDAEEGLRAILERRRPVWKNR